jgi:hypothetical protein
MQEYTLDSTLWYVENNIPVCLPKILQFTVLFRRYNSLCIFMGSAGVSFVVQVRSVLSFCPDRTKATEQVIHTPTPFFRKKMLERNVTACLGSLGHPCVVGP